MVSKIKRGSRRMFAIALSVLMLLSAWVFVAPETLPKASAANTALTDWPDSGDLNGKYKVTSNKSVAAGSNRKITGNTVIYIASGATLTVTGGGGSGTGGGNPGIFVQSGYTLVITGPGKLVAAGGAGAKGSNGSGGGSPPRWPRDFPA